MQLHLARLGETGSPRMCRARLRLDAKQSPALHTRGNSVKAIRSGGSTQVLGGHPNLLMVPAFGFRPPEVRLTRVQYTIWTA
jgi:hypothetical protein